MKGKPKKEKPTWNQPKDQVGNTKKKMNAISQPKMKDFINTTPKGHKKDLSMIDMEGGYQPSAVECAWQDWWEKCGYYSCSPNDAMNRPVQEKFIMVIPPPNVTGSLHLGHALTAAVEDTLTRWHRMKGHATLYVPGNV
jgi:valyl-tRNA synthetase